MESMKQDSMKRIDENPAADETDEDLVFDSESDDDSDFDTGIISDLEEELDNCIINHQKPYKVITEAAVRHCQERDIKNISDILSITKDEASLLLLHFDWNANAVLDEWFTNGQKLREELGLTDVPMDVAMESPDAKDVTCGICSGNFSRHLVAAASCGHIFCNTCWTGYIGTSIKDGLACLKLRCPDSSCNTAVGLDMINMLASDDDKEIYARYFRRSYIGNITKAKWCPAPGCNYAVLLVNGCRISRVTCKCSYCFCWKCTKEAHQPISCTALSRWEVESLVQAQNRRIATKSCPNCGRVLEVNSNCNRMECESCNFHFCNVSDKTCRLCLGSWLKEVCVEGNQINQYKHICCERKLKQVEKDEERRKIAQESVIRYDRCHNQWKTHDMHLQAAVQEAEKLENGMLISIADEHGLRETEISFVTEAWQQIADCKRICKWACVYEYYLPNFAKERRILFNYLLRRAEVVLEQLYQCTAEPAIFNLAETSADKLLQTRNHLCLKTSVARNYFDNMVWAMENGHSNMNTLRRTISSRSFQLGLATTAAGGNNGARGCTDETKHWTCPHCKFTNDLLAYICVMCYH
ncbi:probable E3 ubiquitin-protein ligase ARI8 isoform X3 [Beta vulgaris subsp. vulgaris]|uniref:probable E3 ubiquitin-protein ligase ARI8 isoform X3 n=1 Tax=Beta vulgaris subsp. vulgaris TaxID=3555 RepID=UPI0020374021|nr:probable E3 ubiquitin-protein ligase ARI8 isoform X3 [Beta vulgaris subsp. vulgaris]